MESQPSASLLPGCAGHLVTKEFETAKTSGFVVCE